MPTIKPATEDDAICIGKSEGVKQVAAELGAVMVDIRLSQYDSDDLRGTPVLTSDGLTGPARPADGCKK